jgi:phage tail-like protein
MSEDSFLHEQAVPSFRFVIDVSGERQGAFTECTLPTIEWDAEEVKEGGLNTFIHQLPGRRKSAHLSLKNGVGRSQLLEWYIQAMGGKITRRPVTITLLGANFAAVLTWNIQDAYPVKWTGPQLKTDANTIAIQSLDLACGEITIQEV